MAVESPPEIDVHIPLNHIWGGGEHGLLVPMYTKLFRAVCKLPQALEVAYQRNPDSENLSVISAGCSIGAEADSIIALSSKTRPDLRIDITGLDANPTAVQIARRAVYYLCGPNTTNSEEVTELTETLHAYGFQTEETGDWTSTSTDFKEGWQKVVSAAIREPHQAEFERCDLRSEIVTDKKADLILVNNLLYHLHPREADAIIDNLVLMLNDRGIISLGATPGDQHPMGRMFNRSTMKYGDWLIKTEERLKSAHGLEAVARYHYDLPEVLARV